MEGQAIPEDVDKTVDERFQMLATTNFSSPVRTKGQWYVATPPIVREWTKLGVADYFGRTMVAALPSNVKVGVVDVAVGGIAIEGFMSNKVADYLSTSESWLQDIAAQYNNNPYQYLVDMAKIAQQKGVIKGILMHQGESNNGQQAWLQNVKQVYESLLTDLGLNATDVPLYAGETVNADVGGICSGHNTIIAQLPEVIPTAHVVPSNGCPCASDNVHFTADGYRTMGKRYAYEVLRTMGVEPTAQSDYVWDENLKQVYEFKDFEPIEDIVLKFSGSKRITVFGTFADGHTENISKEVEFKSDDFIIRNDMVVASEAKKGTVTAVYTDFFGQKHEITVNVEVSDNESNNVLVINNGTVGENQWDKEAICKLAVPMEQGKNYVIRATVRADISGDCSVWPRNNASTNRDQWGNSADIQYLATNNVSSIFQELSWKFNATYPHDELVFAIGKLGGNVYIDDVSCMEEGGATEMIANGSFDSDDISNWSVLSWTGQSLKIDEDNFTGIETKVVTGKSNDIYDLTGRKVKNPQRGAYITGGKIVIY